MKFFKKRGRKAFKPRRRFFKRKGITTKKAITRIVKRVVARNEENKSKEYVNTRQILPYAGNQDANVIPLSPYASYLDITQGTADGSRIGNRIKIKHASITFTLWPYPYSSSLNAVPIPQDIQFYIFYDRQNDTEVPVPSSNGDFYQNNGSTSTFTGTLTDLTRWVNQDRYRVVYRRRFKLGFAQNAASGADANNANWSNNDYKLNIMNFKVNYTKWLVKNVKYNDNNATPTTRGLFCMWISVPCNGSTWGSTQLPSTVTMQTRVTYEDA